MKGKKMRKILIILLIFIIICFSIPISLTKKFGKADETATTDAPAENEVQNVGEDYTQLPEIKQYNYKNYGTVKVLHTKTNQIEEISIDEYLYGVVSAEMPVNFEIEALKAQAIVARTYTIYKILQNSGKHEGADICDDSTCCQAWISMEDRIQKWRENTDESISSNPDANWNKIVTAVEETKGKIITYNGEPINAFFHSNSGGMTEIPLNVWGGSGYPYLQTVSTYGEDAYTQYSSEVVISKKDFTKKISSKHSDFTIDFTDENQMKVLEYTEGGRVKNIQIGNLQLSGVEVRNILGLKSANFNIAIEEENIKFSVIGYGHGVGMSQTGADSLAKQGNTAEQIVCHFYSGVQLTQI